MNLPPNIVAEATNILVKIPENYPYDIFNAAILKCVGKTKEFGLCHLFSNGQLREPKPSQLLCQMKILLRRNFMTEEILRL